MYNRAFWESFSEIISIAGCVAQLSPEIEKTSGSMLSSVCPSVLAKAHNVCLWHPKDPSLWIISVLVPEEINSPSRLISGGKNERKIIRGEKILGEKSRGAKSGKRRHPVFRKKG